MKIRFVTLCFLFAACSNIMGQNNTPARELLRDYQGSVKLPEDLLNFYAALSKSLATADPAAIQKFCLPHSVSFTVEERPEKTREYGQDINMPFLKNGFHRYILNIRQDSEDAYLIRTGSSYLFFVKTKSEGWKLYRYGDKPGQ